MENKDSAVPEGSLQIPDNISLKFIRDSKHIGNEAWITHINDSFLKIISTFRDEEVPAVCNELSETLYYSRTRGQMNRSEIISTESKILNIGLDRIFTNIFTDSAYQNPGNDDELKHSISTLMTKAGLEYNLGRNLCDRGRPVAGLDYFQRAQEDYRTLSDICKGFDNKSEFDSLWTAAWYTCMARESETWLSIFPYLPESQKPPVSFLLLDSLTEARNAFEKLGKTGPASACASNLQYAEELAREHPMSRKDLEELYTDTIPDGYTRWCNDHCLFLTFIVDMEHDCGRFAADDLDLGLEGEQQLLLEDIISTFCHCRKKLYAINGIDEEIFKLKRRDEDIEELLDCYMRLYSIPDKVAKLIKMLFPNREYPNREHFWDVYKVLEDDKNIYLRSIYLIGEDISTDEGRREDGTADPHRIFDGTTQRASSIRNHIMHNVFRISGESESKDGIMNTFTLTPLELRHHTIVLANNMRELLLSLQLVLKSEKSTNLWNKILQS